MPLPRPLIQMTNYVNSYKLGSRIDILIAGHSLPTQAVTKIIGHGKRLIEHLRQPRTGKLLLKLAITYLASFAFAFALLAALGFGSAGVGAGTLAAAFQAAVYGGFVPAGSLFATLTSMGMLGTLMPVLVGTAAVVATAAMVVVWGFAGRP